MLPVKITVLHISDLKDLQKQYELPQKDPCPLALHQSWVSSEAQMPAGMCTHAWSALYPYVLALASGSTGLFDVWMQKPGTAVVSCPDGFRPVSFLLETID